MGEVDAPELQWSTATRRATSLRIATARRVWGSPGNVTGKTGEATYTWDFENRLVGVVMADGTSVSYAYDDAGNRVSTTTTPPSGTAKTTSYLVDTICAHGTCGGGLSQVVAEVDQATGALAALYVRMGDELVAVMRPDGSGGYTTRWVHHDGIGSVRAITDVSGVVVDERSYEAFGTRIAETGGDPMPYGFAGEPLDSVSGLAYHRARWMDPRVGRFVSVDPWSTNTNDSQSLNRYRYAGNNPALVIDPTGRFDMVDVMVSVTIVSVLALSGVADTPVPPLVKQHSSPYYIDVRATDVDLAPMFDHLFVVVGKPITPTDEGETSYRAGPSHFPLGLGLILPGAPVTGFWDALGWGPIFASAEKYEPGAQDYDAYAMSMEVVSGEGATISVEQCMINEMARINGLKVEYQQLGPNSNTFVSTLLQNCGVAPQKPPGSITPGWLDNSLL